MTDTDQTDSTDQGPGDDATERLLRSLYDAFNARDAEAVIAQLADDVAWPNGWEGGVVHGRDTVREYWVRQWATIDPRVTPTEFAVEDDGRIAVTVDQHVLDLDGSTIAQGTVVHVYQLVDGRVTAMEIREIEVALEAPAD